MNVRLREADARAVDLLLDRATSAGQGSGVMFAGSVTGGDAGVSNGQVAAVEKVLKVLEALPAHDPGQDLMRRTLQRIEAHTASPLRGPSPALIDATRAHA